MSSIVNSLTDLFKAIIGVFWSFFTTAAHLVENTGIFVFKSAEGVVNLILEFFKGLVELAGGIIQFIVGNLIVLGLIAAAGFAFLQYQRKQGNTVQVGNKKLN
ncbi:hypothetical protein K504DRAFT_494195 [Pleomassaria siparia CBS 279.74]|uniref:Uncharacterized protein n=1 Tax=Pleomassaria siparia CBS 279.74 TaxID=1314801 RepID=A0A6G1JYE9_9PLEO|nr:hypothetical protein K504DRAFT_494195 [Pleomassaria siparia CBS 279.74]